MTTAATLAAWLHDLDPFAIEVAPGLGVRWYGLSYLAGFALAWLLMRAMARRGMILIPAQRTFDAVMIIALGAIIGGRLGYVAFYDPSLLWSFSPSFPWWGVLELGRGGMASHGGIAGAIIGAWRVSRGWTLDDGSRAGACPPLHVMDAMAAVAPLGLGLGRLANFVNGELLGRVVAAPGAPAPWWAVRFPQEHLTGHAPALSPEQLRALDALIIDVAPTAASFAEGYPRVIAAVQQGVPGVAQRLEPLLAARHPSQLYQALAEGLVLMAVVWWVWRVPRRPGVVGAAWLITYGMLRIATEHWRLPDDHLAVQTIAGLTRGQWLSALMIAAGLALYAWVRTRRNTPRLGGWRAQPAA